MKAKLQHALSQLPKRLTSWPSLAFLGGSTLIWVAAVTGVTRNYFDSEEFYVLHNASNQPHLTAWKYFFIENGRLIEGIYWTYLYKIFGYNPLVEHSFSLFILLIASILATACFLEIWPSKNKPLAYLLAFLFFTNWISAKAVFRLSYDNTNISLVFFFTAGLLLQQWAKTQKTRWLAPSFLSFLLSLLTYENAAFLFPALLMLAWPLMPPAKSGEMRRRVLKMLAFAGLSGLLLLLPRFLYSFTWRQETATFEISQVGSYILKAARTIYSRFGQFFRVSTLNKMTDTGIWFIIGASAYTALTQRRANNPEQHQDKLQWNCILAACIWFLIFGPLPYIILNYRPIPRVFSSAVFGLFPLILLVLQRARQPAVSAIACVFLLFFAGLGFNVLSSEAITFREGEARLNIFFRGMKDAIPHVRPHTLFLFVNGPPMGIAGCGPSLEMLYGQTDIKCGSVRMGDPDIECPAIRYQEGIEVGCGSYTGQNWILMSVTENVPSILDQLGPNDFDLPITWESSEPLLTDFGKIVVRDLPQPTDFYLHLIQRAQILFPEQ